MANYNSLQDSLAAGASNMTVLRDNVKNDNTTVTYATGIDWFKFNNQVVSNLYSSGNSFMGLGASSEHLKVNRRDAAVYYEYKETGEIQGVKFFKFRWSGYSVNNSTDSDYKCEFEVYLFETGIIYLNFFTVPTQGCDGTNQLVCGNQTISFTVTAGTACDYSFVPSDANGTSWKLKEGKPLYEASGTAILSQHYLSAGGTVKLYWAESAPDWTGIQVECKIDDGNYVQMVSGASVPGTPAAGQTFLLTIKVTLTSGGMRTPKIYNFQLMDTAHKKILQLAVDTPNISPAIGNVGIAYDGHGGLRNSGGPLAPFNRSFTPLGMPWKGHQNDVEHLTVSVSAVGTNTKITYHDTAEKEHLTVSVSASGTLTYVGDL